MASYALLALAAAASFVSAATPPGFQPAASAELVVDYDNTLISGQVVPKNLVQNQPQIGSTQRLPGSSFTVIMLDLDIPTNNPGQTSTLLHWMQMGLTLSGQTTRVGSNNGNNGNGNNGNNGNTNNNNNGNGANNFGTPSAAESVFLLVNGSQQPAAAPYISPNPPARLPLSHRYTQVLVDTSGLSAQSTAMTTLMNAAKTRQGFNLAQVLQQAGLSNKVVAGNFFNVTNPGPVQNGNGNGNGNGNSNGNGNQQNGVSNAGNNDASSTTTTGSVATNTSPNTVTKSGAGRAVLVPGAAVLAGLMALVSAL
ncbi:Phosphatidylethanolamine-binding protein PEBP [Niveomyces insectorum RCEF 264]|uniref:Phosphatidylethanolamine-binding protein PEBP n=1 Tax=Niveomyces insectorum RCEF 264 TaxID=1081102 RepID=A0A167TDB8_9HYPO|nr:Phosphatidylethanolamine-binding protein PEBP [Niveomyces insectorum RCEF 264]